MSSGFCLKPFERDEVSSVPVRCPQCSLQIAPCAPEGLCPQCLFRLGMEKGPNDLEFPPLLQAKTALPLDLLESALRRMSWVGVALAVTAAGVYLEGAYIQPGWINPANAPLSYRLSLWMTVLTGLSLALVSRSRILSTVHALDLGLILQWVAGLFISMAENSVPRLEGEVVRGNSSVAVWIAIFALTIPASFGKALTAALATAAMGPAGLGAQVYLGNVRNPPAPVWLALFSGNFLLAFGATALAKFTYRLGGAGQAGPRVRRLPASPSHRPRGDGGSLARPAPFGGARSGHENRHADHAEW